MNVFRLWVLKFWQKVQKWKKCSKMTSGKAVKMKIGLKIRLKSLGRLKKSVPDERLIQFWTFIPKSLLVLGVEKFPKTAWWEKIQMAAIFHLILNLNLRHLNAKKIPFWVLQKFHFWWNFFNFNHFWNQWPKLIPKLALNLDFDHF